MTPFASLVSVAAPMPEADIDTDILFPARFLVLTDNHGLGRCAFFDRRFHADGSERPEFVLNRDPWRGAGIIVAGPNFGCGSSREQAPWALADLGVRCIVAASFGEIFRANCYANGLLPIALDSADQARALRHAQAGRSFTVDLMGCLIELTGEGAGPAGDGAEVPAEPILFDVPPRQRDALLAGLDAIGLIQRHEQARIDDFERRQRAERPWLFAASPAAGPPRRTGSLPPAAPTGGPSGAHSSHG